MAERTLHDKILSALQDRSVWEERQRLWYEMRHQGVARRSKPFKGAADLHLPLADNAVEKLKPYYINSIFGRQRLASFTSLTEQLGDATSGAADFLDWNLRNESNFPLQIAYVIDLMLVTGPPVLKLRWDPRRRGGRGGLVFEAIDPMLFIVPSNGDELDEMDWFCHVQQLTVAKYLRDPRYQARDADFLARIRGGKNQEDVWKEQERQAREGITYSKDEDEIILYEAFERVEEGWRVRTYSPSAPNEPVREDFILPWKWQGEPFHPFVRWRMEITEKGFYASRGVVEKVAPFETYGTKLWNSKADFLEYAMKPLFTTDAAAPMVNSANITLRPGEILPPGVKSAPMPEPPFALDAEINGVRQLAEERAGSPDFGVGQTDEGKKDNRTATEWNYLGSFASQGIQMKAWVSGQSEGEVYRKAWALHVMYGKSELAYYQGAERKVLPAQAVHDNYLIQPDASPDAWNKQQRMQRSLARFQQLNGHPNINQEELAKSLLEDDDPRLVKRLWVSGGNKAANEAEDEAFEITILMAGFPAQAMPGEDHALRLRILFGKLQQLSMLPMPASQAEAMQMMIGRQRMHEHIGQHVALLKQENPALAKQITQAIGLLSGGAPAPGQPGQPAGGAGFGNGASGATETATLGPAATGGAPALPAPQGVPEALTMGVPG